MKREVLDLKLVWNVLESQQILTVIQIKGTASPVFKRDVQ
jgi:hypothetical protein